MDLDDRPITALASFQPTDKQAFHEVPPRFTTGGVSMLKFAKSAALLVLPAVVVVSATLIPATAANAASRQGNITSIAATSCSSNEKQGGVDELSVTIVRVVEAINPEKITSYIELWYSPACRYVWAVEGGGPLEGDHIWVYNEDTGVSENAYYPSTSTAAIDDAGTESHACLENSTAAPFPKTCTAYF